MARNERDNPERLHSNLISQLAGTNSLPSLPQISSRLISQRANSSVESDDVADVIKLDPALSYQVLNVANSIVGGGAQSVANVEHAVQIVGTGRVAQLVNWAATLDVFDTFSFCNPSDLTRYWVHSLKCALLSARLSEAVGMHDKDGAYLAGLLHDVGKLALLSSFPNKYRPLFARTSNGEARVAEEEKAVGYDHASAGAAMVRRWPRQSLVADAIRYHHEPVERVSNTFPLVKIVYAANLLANADGTSPEVFERSGVRLLELGDAQLGDILDSITAECDEVCAGLGIDQLAPKAGREKEPAAFANSRATLAGDVRSMSLLGGLAQALLKAKGVADVVSLVEQVFDSQFHINRLLFFLADNDGTTLKAHGQAFQWALEQTGTLTISTSSTDCIPVAAFERAAVIDSFSVAADVETTILDSQIVALLGAEGMLCLPLAAGDERVGVLVLGLDRTEFGILSAQHGILSRITSVAAAALSGRQDKSTGADWVPADTLQSTLTLARKVVHEVNNPLGIISNYLSVLARRLDEQEIEHDEIRIIDEEIIRVRDILRLLTDASKEQAVSLAPVDLNALLLDLIRLMKADLSGRQGVQIHSSLNSSLPMALTDKDMLKQALINLLKNSGEALSAGGNIHVQTTYVADESSAVDGTPGNHHGRAQLVISDDGPGIPEKLRGQVFQPFVTSKSGHEGLGLSIVQKLIDQLCGTITCESGEDSGTKFTIQLPVAST